MGVVWFALSWVLYCMICSVMGVVLYAVDCMSAERAHHYQAQSPGEPVAPHYQAQSASGPITQHYQAQSPSGPIATHYQAQSPSGPIAPYYQAQVTVMA